MQGPVSPPSGLLCGGPGAKVLSQVTVPEGSQRLPLPCDSQILPVKETVKEKSLWANEEAEEQRGDGICPKSHSKLAAETDAASALSSVCLC